MPTFILAIVSGLLLGPLVAIEWDHLKRGRALPPGRWH